MRIEIPVNPDIVRVDHRYGKYPKDDGWEYPINQVALWRAIPRVSRRWMVVSLSPEKIQADTMRVALKCATGSGVKGSRKKRVIPVSLRFIKKRNALSISSRAELPPDVVNELRHTLSGKGGNVPTKEDKAVRRIRKAIFAAYADALVGASIPTRVDVHPDDLGRLMSLRLVESGEPKPAPRCKCGCDGEPMGGLGWSAKIGFWCPDCKGLWPLVTRFKMPWFSPQQEQELFSRRRLRWVMDANRDWWEATCERVKRLARADGDRGSLVAEVVENPMLRPGDLTMNIRPLIQKERDALEGKREEQDEQ